MQELDYWKRQKTIEGELSNDHFVHFYTEFFGLGLDFYSGKRILDIGCGPRGSLEWANMALERVGLDSLASQYLRLGADRHAMKYVSAHSESIPFPDRHFDVVCSFNSLDHVTDLHRTISEIKRITSPDGLFLLITYLNHDATACEPQEFSWDIVEAFSPEFTPVQEQQYEKSGKSWDESIRKGVPYDHSNSTRREGILTVKFRRSAKVLSS